MAHLGQLLGGRNHSKNTASFTLTSVFSFVVPNILFIIISLVMERVVNILDFKYILYTNH